jgi:hypothetical protein
MSLGIQSVKCSSKWLFRLVCKTSAVLYEVPSLGVHLKFLFWLPVNKCTLRLPCSSIDREYKCYKFVNFLFLKTFPVEVEVAVNLRQSASLSWCQAPVWGL